MTVKTLVIFANSVKNQQHCVAGRDISNNQWVRPVSTMQGAELSRRHTSITNPYGRFPVKPLQKVVINFRNHAPLLNQPENWLIDENISWVQRYRIEQREIKNYLDNPTDLWGNSDNVSFFDIQNRQVIINQSLYLVRVSNLRLYRNQWNRRRANFIYNSINYDFSVTDPNFNNLVINNQTNHQSAILCVSLGEPWQQNNRCYKIVAAIYVGESL